MGSQDTMGETAGVFLVLLSLGTSECVQQEARNTCPTPSPLSSSQAHLLSRLHILATPVLLLPFTIWAPFGLRAFAPVVLFLSGTHALFCSAHSISPCRREHRLSRRYSGEPF